jgi:diguanylate cyclase (GGDEF)-like protein
VGPLLRGLERRSFACSPRRIVWFDWGKSSSLDNRVSGKDEQDTSRDDGSRRGRRGLLGLQFRFTVLVLSLTLSVAALVGLVLVDVAGVYASRYKREQCEQVSSLLARCAGPAFARGNAAALQGLAEDFCDGGPILFVIFSAIDGRPVAGADASSPWRARLAHVLANTTEQRIVGQPVFVPQQDGVAAHLQATYPVSDPGGSGAGQGSLLGYVSVGLDVQRTMGDLAAAIDLFSGAGISVLILTIPLAYLLVRCVVLPLNELSRTVRRFAAGDLSARSTVQRGDEIGELAGAFNQMADQLANKHQQILSLNADLEARVQKRTRQLRELASREPLTGLYNRRHFNEVVAQRLSEAVRYGADLSCLMIDLDDFKTVNDHFGHHVGDDLLVMTATTIASQLRAADVAARYGGDEFVVLLPQTAADRAEVLAARITEKFALDVAEQLPRLRVGLSVGVASLAGTSPAGPEDLVRAADQAMYQAKAQGKGRIVVAADPSQYLTSR